jgi:predicted RNA polymerase sigma factor
MAATGLPLDVLIEHLLRELTPQVLGIVVRRFRDFSAVEDAVQEASISAALQWPRDGIPDNPRAWLTKVAFRRMADHIRSELARRRRENDAAIGSNYGVGPLTVSKMRRRKTTRSSYSSCAVILP